VRDFWYDKPFPDPSRLFQRIRAEVPDREGQDHCRKRNRAHGIGALDIISFEPFSKNPAISKVFREIGYADQLGSGMHNSYKYTRLYSGAEPEFIEEDIFNIIIPLSVGSMTKVRPGTSLDASAQVSAQVVKSKMMFQLTSPEIGTDSGTLH